LNNDAKSHALAAEFSKTPSLIETSNMVKTPPTMARLPSAKGRKSLNKSAILEIKEANLGMQSKNSHFKNTPSKNPGNTKQTIQMGIEATASKSEKGENGSTGEDGTNMVVMTEVGFDVQGSMFGEKAIKYPK